MQKHTQELRTGWFMKEHGEKATIDSYLPVNQVPSQVHIDLLANNIIKDPFLDANELSIQWIAEKDWVYRTTFQTPSLSSEFSQITTDLVFHGLDTFATVTLNGTIILSSDNMHTQHRVDISHLLAANGAENELSILFEPALLRGRELVTQHPEHTFHVRQTESSRIPVRKAQYNWGWDWGPILMTAGPWRPVVLEWYVARIEDVWVRYEISQNLRQSSGYLFARVSKSGAPGKVHTVIVFLKQEAGGRAVFRQAVQIMPGMEDDVVKVPFTIEVPDLWYPNGYGSQARYQLSAELFWEDRRLDSVAKLVGFRQCELIQEKDEYGKSFYFRLNGIDIFAGGSCWIPPDSFLARMSRDRYAKWMRLLVGSNQVMIRVWGGGIYEDDAFFDAADELGILVWQDFAFACASYPVFPAFLGSVEEEARQNIRRLMSHPSLVIWAGNNEDYQVQERYQLEYDPEDRDPESWRRSTFPARYIYEYLLPKWVHEEDPSVIYHPGSPWGDGKHSADPTVGDIHQWNIWHGRMDRYQDALVLSGRFVSEFGMEAYPHLSTIRRSLTNPSQHHPGSMMMDFRNKADGHERRLMSYVTENFLVPSDLQSFAHVTQILQSETMRYAYKAWRRMWGRPGARKCGGALVWQLNDCWPTISWAIVDYYGIRKPASYAIARALRPLDVSVWRQCPGWTGGHADPFTTSNAGSCKFEVWIASSLLAAVEVDVTIRFISIASGRLIRETITRKITAKPNATTEVLENQHVKRRTPQSVDIHDPFIIHAVMKTAEGQVVATDTAWPQPLKYLDFPNRNVEVRVSPSGDRFTVSADLPVKGFVVEEREDLELSDNGFDIIPGEEQVVTVAQGSIPDEDLVWTYIGANKSASGHQ